MTHVSRSIDIAASLERVWPVVGDVRVAAECLPGLTVGSARDARTFEAALTVPVGLLTVRYAGALQIDAVDAQRRSVRFRVRGVAPGGLTLAVGVAVGVMARDVTSSRLTVANDITLDLLTSLMAGAMVGQVGTVLLDGFARNVRALFDAAIPPPRPGPP